MPIFTPAGFRPETGIWVPSFDAGGVTYNEASGEWTRIGDLVVASFALRFLWNGTGQDGFVWIEGLPFAARDLSGDDFTPYGGDLVEFVNVGGGVMPPNFAGFSLQVTNFVATTQISLTAVRSTTGGLVRADMEVFNPDNVTENKMRGTVLYRTDD